MLLATHVKSKGDLFCIGQDIDETSIKMCTVNFWVMGVRGSVLQMDSLTGTFYQGYRINKYLYHGIPVPHIEEIHSAAEALKFIELNRLNDDDKAEVNNTDENTSVTETITKPTGQTTLI